MDYLEIRPSYFMKLLDKFRSPHLWKKIKGEWKLRHTANKTEQTIEKNFNID